MAMLSSGGEQRCSTTLPSEDSKTAVLERHSVTTECVTDYKGNLLPHMRWYGPEPFAQIQQSIPTMSYSAMQSFVNRSMDQGSWRSVVNFTAPLTPPPADSASNVPDFEMIYTTPTITVNCE